MDIVGRRYDTEAAVCIRLDGSKIQSISPYQESARSVADLPWISPGFVDLQVNGFRGRDFTSPDLTADDVADVSLAMDAMGVTAYCPTLTTNAYATLHSALRVIDRACESTSVVRDRVIGIHLEGPFISPENGPRGAHPLEHVRPPDWDEFQRLREAAGGRICLLTMSPEYDNSAQFIQRAVNSGILVAIGHTKADSAQLQAAVDAGARLSTHLGNGAHVRLPRHPNYIWDQLSEDRLTASLIADGHHLPPAVLKSFVRSKTPARAILVSDITALAGMPPGCYDQSGLGAIEVLEDGRLVIAGQRDLQAGASLQIGVGIRNLVRHTDCGLRQAVGMASTLPARLVGRPAIGLEVGAPADLTLFYLPCSDGTAGEFEVVATILAGQCVFGAPPAPVH